MPGLQVVLVLKDDTIGTLRTSNWPFENPDLTSLTTRSFSVHSATRPPPACHTQSSPLKHNVDHTRVHRHSLTPELNPFADHSLQWGSAGAMRRRRQQEGRCFSSLYTSSSR